MQVECDPQKSAANLKKHGVSFQEAETVFYDPLGLTCEDDEAQGEARFITVGLGRSGKGTYSGLDTTRREYPPDFSAGSNPE